MILLFDDGESADGDIASYLPRFRCDELISRPVARGQQFYHQDDMIVSMARENAGISVAPSHHFLAYDTAPLSPDERQQQQLLVASARKAFAMLFTACFA